MLLRLRRDKSPGRRVGYIVSRAKSHRARSRLKDLCFMYIITEKRVGYLYRSTMYEEHKLTKFVTYTSYTRLIDI